MEPPNWMRKWAKHSREIFDNFAFNGYSDATICCGGKRIPVHKLVLATASDFFKEIINSSTASHPIIIIENVDRKILERLLMFIYRGEIVLLSSETLALFNLAKDLQIKGLSGPIGSSYNWLYDVEPSSGLDILNLNVFRTKVKPCEPQSDSDLNTQIYQVLRIQKHFANKHRMMMPHPGSSSAENEKTSVVKDKKYKSAFRNRSSVYIKGSGSSTLPDDNEKEICTQLRNISLVKDSSKTFTPNAVKDLVGRLGSVLSIEESDEKDNEQVPAASEQSPSSSQERPKEFKCETFSKEFKLSECTKGEDSIPYQMEPHNFSKIGDEMLDHSDEERPRSCPLIEDLTHQGSGGESLKSALDEQSASQVPTLLCNKCQFETRRKNIYFLHQKFHNYQTLKAKYSLLKQEKLEDFLKRKSFLRMSKRNSNIDSLEKFKLPTVCGSCKVWFDSEDQMITHLASHKCPGVYSGSRYAKRRDALTPSADTKKRAYLCLFCSFRSHDIETLNKHRKTHTSGKLLSCDLCPNRTSRLCPHKLNGEKILRCSHCSFRSTTPKMLLLHKKVHFKSGKHKEVKQEALEQH